MGMETNELDTREEDFHRNNKTLGRWEEEEARLKEEDNEEGNN